MANKRNNSGRKLLTVGPDAPFQFTEAYKSLRTNLEFLSATTGAKIILVTSSVPEEGKSNVAVNLAMTMAESGRRVVLMDGDLRKGTLSRYLHIPASHPGITSRIAGSADWQDVLVPMKKSSLVVLPTGPLPPNPAEMLGSDRMQELFAGLRDYAEYVIVDTPPVTVVTDAAIMSRWADGVVLVVRPGVTMIQNAQLSKKNLEAVDAKILGVVVNGYDAKKSNRKDGYYYTYSYDNYYSDENARTEESKNMSRKRK